MKKIINLLPKIELFLSFCIKALIVFWASVFGFLCRHIGHFLHIKVVEPADDFIKSPPILKFWSLIVILCICLAVLASWQASDMAWRL